tara:strand:+ start:204 stop:506 length:303 start_codon:yes stop_codon:yes gene_type:complete
MKYLKIIFLFFIFISINNCQNFQSVMTGAKKETTDEFLVKKKDPLILPPQYEKLPLPNSKETKKENNIQSVLGTSTQSSENSKINSKLENLILKELKNKK